MTQGGKNPELPTVCNPKSAKDHCSRNGRNSKLLRKHLEQNIAISPHSGDCHIRCNQYELLTPKGVPTQFFAPKRGCNFAPKGSRYLSPLTGLPFFTPMGLQYHPEEKGVAIFYADKYETRP